MYMASLINALDNFTPTQQGENGHNEFAWSNSVRERIAQFSFQLTRASSSTTIHNLSCTLNRILLDIAGNIEYLSIMYRMIGQTRDLVDGKGEYTLAYMQLAVWSKHYPALAKFAFRYFVLGDNEMVVHPYGSWKDVKHLIKYIETEGSVQRNDKKKKMSKSVKYEITGEDELVQYAIELVNEQLRKDAESTDAPSLVAKWVPREKSQHSKLFARLACHYFSTYLQTATTEDARQKATIKAKMDYRRLISSLNKKLDTVQIKQCANTWSEIEPSSQTSVTLHKQKKAFLNLTKKGQQRTSLDDRIQCAHKFEEFAQKAEKGEVEVKGKRIGLNDFTKEAIQLLNSRQHNSSEAHILNAQWVNNATQTGALGKMIAMVDVSGSMSGDPLNAAIALGVRIAEKSALGRRVLTFSDKPNWVNLDHCPNFISAVQVLQTAEWGMSTNFSAALQLILNAIVENKLPAEDVEGMVLTILSDMQINSGGSISESMMDLIKKEYADAGMKICGKPYNPPHILFWNLRSTNGFPTLSTESNASMMSGFSPALLNLFCNVGMESLQNSTPWSILVESLNNPRYMVLDAKIRNNSDPASV